MVFQGPSATFAGWATRTASLPIPAGTALTSASRDAGTATSLNSDPDGDAGCPTRSMFPSAAPIWFWSTKNEKKVLTPDQLLAIYYRSVGRGAQLLLNIPANRDGLLPIRLRVSRDFGLEIRTRFAKPLAETTGQGTQVTLKLGAPMRMTLVILQEDIAKGERVREFRIEGHVGGTWRTLGEGAAIGHKRIQPVEPVDVDALRIVTTRVWEYPSFAAWRHFTRPRLHQPAGTPFRKSGRRTQSDAGAITLFPST